MWSVKVKVQKIKIIASDYPLFSYVSVTVITLFIQFNANFV